LPPVSTTPAANWQQVSVTPVANNGNSIRLLTQSELEDKMYLYVDSTTPKIILCHRCVDNTSGAPKAANIAVNFQKNLKWSKWDPLGLGETDS
jgi:hypothetical protein